MMNAANERVISVLNELNIECDITLLDHETRTSTQAANTLNCSVSQIAKSMIFKSGSGQAVLAVTSGSNRVRLDLLAEIIGQSIGKADAEFVRAETGFVIGGVAPVGMIKCIETVFDRFLFQYEIVWAAAGTPNSLFPIKRSNLYKLADGRIFDFTEPLD